ncbi:efflux RND transporter periplasmic adaptor subunit [Sphingomonas sp. H39-1-10]|uniref:efflux RND transporter periplasmic adaptor subunit n=1 Tax=Sphingomonas pollutisoli TaxID=3030829 RepID=UPI0023B8F200|nr:efflux RND transporter periplasmic adaptor subunit [Sphingomonas pollutisoli]MDF0490530.1 efflux RND transporter periplasmic adaptor subunit [Sphingomonas pollutisoli]
MKTLAPLCLILLAGCGSSAKTDPAPTPRVLVSLQKIERGQAPEWLTAYGSAAPAISGSQTVSVPQPGQVSRLAVTPGSIVRAGQLLAVFTTDPSSVSTYQQAVTALSTAQKQRTTTAQLLTQQLATRDQLTQADKAVSDAQAAIGALQRSGAGQPTRALSAPFAGIVTTVSVAQGDRTQPGAPIMTIARTGSIVATVGLDPVQASRVRVGQQARIARLNGGPSIPGRVIRIDGVLNLKTRLIDIDLSFPAGALLPNEALRGEIAVGVVNGWVVPHRAVVAANGPPRIFQQVNGKARAVKVNLLLPGDQVDVVEGGIDPNRRLIVDGAYQVDDGAPVRSSAR